MAPKRLLSIARRFHREKAHSFKENVEIGEFTYKNPQIYMYTSKYRLVIGKFCSISNNVKIIVDGNHRADWITTYPFGELIDDVARNPGHPAGNGDMKIGNDVWIGLDALILPGVQIGDGAVVGAGSVVTHNVNDYEIVGGNPARHIRNRFTDSQIKKLKEIAWWDWPKSKIKAKYALLQSQNIDEFINNFGDI
jgi:acetyltransferase-like isoleucine patch superfamily enzyme